MDEVTFKPCKFCGSLDYDIVQGDVDDKNVLEPETCDQCNFGHIEGSNIPLH